NRLSVNSTLPISTRTRIKPLLLVEGSDYKWFSGFGRAFVLKCLDNGLMVFAGCRTVELQGVKSLTEECNGRGGILHAFELDVTSDESVQNAKNYVEEQLQRTNKSTCQNNIRHKDTLT
ncbi:unnamed protein product, partial [Gongylonema pulchrum]|uniref:MutS_I domain-containing protein n=1 Tax=Gongylonema pulchrum TaxID=637853 RepID=A0A183DZM4_9BILA